jgi:hypothetical protein
VSNAKRMLLLSASYALRKMHGVYAKRKEAASVAHVPA